MRDALKVPKHKGGNRFAGKRVAVVCAGSPTAGAGGAERFYAGLKRGFESIGCTVEFVEVEASEPSVSQILENYRLARSRDLAEFDIVVSSKAPTYAVSHHNHVVYLNHAVRIFDDMFEFRFPHPSKEDFLDRAEVLKADFEALKRVRSIYAQGDEIDRRLMRWRGLRAQVMHPPLPIDNFRPGVDVGEHFLLAGRLHAWKRVDLLINAFRELKGEMKLLIAGTGEELSKLKQLAQGDDRIVFLGRIDDETLVDLYSRAVAVPFIPIREDYGYVTLEAFASACPVLTCADSGEPANIVRNQETGLVVDPNPRSIARGLEWFWKNRAQARQMGRRGLEELKFMDWKDTAYALASAAVDGIQEPAAEALKVAILDMQPIHPPVGGGRLRLLGLYHSLGTSVDGQYIGTYDWPGEKYRAHRLGPSLFETDFPLSDAHFQAARDLAEQAGGKNVIDLAFSRQAMLSPDFVAGARQAAENADVVVFSHPWVFPLVRQNLRPNQIVIYDSHNVEGFLRAQFLSDSSPEERKILTGVIEDELTCGRRADWILACSHEDLLRFHRLYGFTPEKMRVVPNGSMVFTRPAPSAAQKAQARTELGLAGGLVGIFIGSGYGPNVDAARFINDKLAPACAGVTFVIAGGVGAEIEKPAHNVVITGIVDDVSRDRWLTAADFGLNPMMSGSGTNIKMFDYMTMGLPIITSDVGARGIETSGQDVFRIAKPETREMAAAIAELGSAELREKIGAAARICVEENYAWEIISGQLGLFMRMRAALAGQSRPHFTVVIPSYERHGKLAELMDALSRQIDRDFEVVVVDQSDQPWVGASRNWGFPLFYYHSPVKGAVRARNTGAMLAQGSIIAFVDDDCLPEPEWLLNARRYFQDPEVVGVEGMITSDHHDDPAWRPVSNVGFEGIGFMTANLFVRSAVFQYLGGLDLQFDKPHFREDTDLGWRMLAVGKVPYGKDVVVFHPAQPRDLERESSAERNKFFIKDARLWQKHPAKYRQLFFADEHYRYTTDFRKYFLQGLAEIGVPQDKLPRWLKKNLKL